MRPAVITCTVSARPATRPRSCSTTSRAVPSAARAQDHGQRPHFGGVQTGRGLVQEQGVRAAREGPGQFGAAQGPGGEVGGGAVPQFCEAEEAQGPRGRTGGGARRPVRAHLDVLGDGERGEDGQLLEGTGRAGAGTGVCGQAGDVTGAEGDAARRGAQGAGQTVEEGALARPVGADDGGDAAGRDGEADAVEGGEPLVDDGEAVGGQGVASGVPWWAPAGTASPAHVCAGSVQRRLSVRVGGVPRSAAGLRPRGRGPLRPRA